MTTGILGKKLGMSQVFDTEGKVIPVTVIEAGPCTVIQRKTARTDGYDAVQIGFRQTKAAKVGKPMLGHFQKAGKGAFSALQEIRVEAAEPLDIGAEIKVDIFKEGDVVDVMGHSKGRGFTGVIKNMKMAGQYGNERVTILNLRVVGVEPEKNLLLVRGAVPGAKNSLVFVRRAVKKLA